LVGIGGCVARRSVSQPIGGMEIGALPGQPRTIEFSSRR
jgi:hypothetical protein